METKSNSKLRQLKSGVHLVCITDASIIKDSNQMPLITPEGETGILIRFSTGDNQHYDQDYWLNGNRQSYFNKMCASAKIDTANPKFRAESKGKRLWICVKEVHDIDGDKTVVDELTGPAINYYMFDTIPCVDPLRKPIVKGNPDDNEGVASGVFLDYRQIGNRDGTSTQLNFVDKDIPLKGNIRTSESSEYKGGILDMTKEDIEKIAEKMLSEPNKILDKPKSNEPINWDDF